MNDDFASLRQDHHQQKIMQVVEEQTVERLYDAATHLSVTDADVDAVVTGIDELERAGFRPSNDDGDVLITGYASPEFYYTLRDSTPLRYEPSEEIDTVQVYDINIRIAPSLPDGSAVLIHDNALIPSLIPASTKPFIVRHEQGIVVLNSE